MQSLINISPDFSFSYSKDILFSLKNNNDPLLIENGKIYGLFGNNGCGKTTLLNIINSFLPPTTGNISYSFANTTFENCPNSKGIKSELISNNIRRSFQVPFLVDDLNILENIFLSQRIKNEESFARTFLPNETGSFNKDISDMLKLGNFTGREKAEILSYGQRRIVSNLQLLFSNASLLLLDEPFANLHFEMINKLKIQYLKKKKQFNTTVIIVEHTCNNLNNFADELILIEGKNISKETLSC